MSAAALLVAHHNLGHWFTSLIVYLVPVLLLGAWLVFVARRAKRAPADSAKAESSPLDSSDAPVDD